MLHEAGAESLRVRDVRCGLLLRQDLAAAAHVRPLRLLCAARAAGPSDYPLQGLFCPRHAQSGWIFKCWKVLYLHYCFSRIFVTHQAQGWNIAGAPKGICVTGASEPRAS